MRNRILNVVLILILLQAAACATTTHQPAHESPDAQTSFEYLKDLEGQWVVDGGDEGIFGWEFEITARGTIVIERLKVGTPTEMTTVYHIENGQLRADHYCQLGNQPHLAAVNSETPGDLHFLCNGKVGSTASHHELHMHRVHFKTEGENVRVWMDMVKDDEVAFQTTYTLVRSQ